jgi:hypothetical protein
MDWVALFRAVQRDHHDIVVSPDERARIHLLSQHLPRATYGVDSLAGLPRLPGGGIIQAGNPLCWAATWHFGVSNAEGLEGG